MSNKKISLLIIFCFIAFAVKSQSNDDCKYLAVLFYLRTNKAVNDEIKMTFPKLTRKKDNYIDFSVSDQIKFLGVGSFKGYSNLNSFNIDSTLINDDQLYYDKYFFNSFKSNFLTRVMEQPEQDKAKFYMTFSKPIGDYLVAELEILDPRIHPDMGKAMQMLFKFDSDGLIHEVLYAWVAYR